jgi:creatinine amidohydrolase/Fe(II)-dependent formamide hydrolase-like protein
MPSAKRGLVEPAGGAMREAAVRRPVIRLPLGGHEDQGPRATMGDGLSAEAAALRIAARAAVTGWDA